MTPPSSPLPVFPERHDRDAAALDASRAVVGLFLSTRSGDWSVRALAQHAGLSERTFYRYFPRKEDAIRPYVAAGLDQIVGALRAAPPGQPLVEALVAAHAPLLDLALAHDGRALLDVLNQTAPLRAVWLAVLTDAEAAFAAALADRLGLAPDAARVRLAAAVVVAAGRLALQSAGTAADPRAPSQVFADGLALLGPALFEGAPAEGAPQAPRSET